MGCTVCGSSAPCRCRSQNVVSCSNIVPASPMPYYDCASPCPENHVQKFVLQQFYGDINVANTWNIPACGLSATLTVPGLKSINVGSYIWNATYGYFEINSFDAATGDLVVINNCNAGNASPGTTVPSCTSFTISDPPCDCPSADQTCVAIDFTAPAVDDCLDITLTNENNLRASDTIQIGSGFYFVSAIKPNNVITICNHGEGITPGTPVIAKDANDNYQYCISIISSNPCSATPIIKGKVLVCDSEDVAAPLNNPHDGYIIYGATEADNEAFYGPLDANSPICVQLAADLNIVNGTANYSLVVDSSVGFATNDILIVGNRTDRFTVTGVPDGTHINGTFSPVPAATVTVPTDTVVCQIGCCEHLQNEIDDLPCSDALFGDMADGFFFPAGGFEILHTINPSDAVFTSAPIVFDPLVNHSTCRDMNYQEAVSLSITGSVEFCNLDPCFMKIELLRNLNGGAYSSVASKTVYIFTSTDAATNFDLDLTFLNTTMGLAPAGTATIGYKLQATITATMSGAAYTASASGIAANLIGINV